MFPSQPIWWPWIVAAGHLAALNSAVEELASVMMDPLYLGLLELTADAVAAAPRTNCAGRSAWRQLVATLTAIEKYMEKCGNAG
jgi:hypothetical protein